MNKELFIFDHDGFLTDPQKAHFAYTDIFEEEFSQKTGIPRGIIHSFMEAERVQLRRNPQMYSFQNTDGYKVAPATFDTYVLNSVAAVRAIEAMHLQKETRLPDPKAVNIFLGELYSASYGQLGRYYRPEAAQMIRELQPLGRLVIVSNSHPQHLLDKIRPFLDENHIPSDAINIVGQAQKFTITPSWNKVPETTRFPGLGRDVLLRRGYYGEIILNLGQEPYLIAGDSGEVDLVTPRALNFRTVLLRTPFTPPWEENVFETRDSMDEITHQVLVSLGR